jgi:hypothetical protein
MKQYIKLRPLSTLIVASLLMVSVGIGGGLLTVPTAHAISGVNICLSSQPNECIVTHGVGNRVTIETSGYARFSITNISGTDETRIVDSNGDCLRAQDAANGEGVVIANGRCLASDTSSYWVQGGTGNITFLNLGNGANGYMGTFGINSGRPVYTKPPQTGFYRGWILFQ